MVLATKGDHVIQFILLISKFICLVSFIVVENSESTDLSKIFEHDLKKKSISKEELSSNPLNLRSAYFYGMRK